ncbi:beta-ketoacyl synthase chain length factor [Sphingobacterium lactis]|uniref:beta-ketoacyl synthase chain length factor n=1 Tax=Sphingobacterium lactis TaxID=797291 RepID=UPI003EC9138D
MGKCYINGIGSVSIQALEFTIYEGTPTVLQHRNTAVHPDYKTFIPAGMLRRMASGVKMGIFAARQAMQDADQQNLDAIITGTSLGCLQDSEKFLDAMIENQEVYLTPTSFIQSTHNTVAAQIALQLPSKAYNFTYVNGGNSFEAALFDGLQQIHTEEAQNILVGGLDETAPQFDHLFQLAGNYKNPDAAIDFQKPKTAGIPVGEGANFFILTNQQTENTYAELLDVHLFNYPRIHAEAEIEEFLSYHGLDRNSIDVLVLGYNADQQQQSFMDEYAVLFPNTPQAYYQHLSGAFDTASAYGLKVACEVLRQQELPKQLQYNQIKPIRLKHILLISQSRGTDYSFVLLRSC